MDTSEDILLAKCAGKMVKGHKDVKGMLVIRETWLTWEPEDKGSAESVSLSISSIKKKQQVTGKPFLRILSDAAPLGLAFHTEKDKDEVLEMLKPREFAKRAVSSLVPGPAEQSALFASDRDLKALYNQLVPSGILTEAEFWESHDEKRNRGKIVQLGQRLGLPSVMHEVEKLHDGKTERVNIHLKPQDIQRIFQDRPEISRAFTSYVPHAMTEQEFWQEYFKLEYKRAAKRKKAASSGKGFHEESGHDEGDIFAPFRQYALEEEAKLSKSKLEKVDPTLNLMAEYGERWSGGNRVLGCDQMRSAEVGTLEKMEGGKAKPGNDDVSFLANDINRHACHVLDGSLDVLGETTTQNGVSSASLAASIEEARKKYLSKESEMELKKEIWKTRASSGLQDLSEKFRPDALPLSIHDKSVFSQISNGEGAVNGNRLNSSSQIHIHIDSGSLLDETEINHEKYIQVLEEFATADNEMTSKDFGSLDYLSSITSSEETMGSVMSDFFRLEAMKTNELLRHLWLSFPMSTEASRIKANRLVKHLAQQKEGLLAHLRSQTGGQLQVCISKVVAPLIDAIDATLETYNNAIKISL